MSGRRFSFDDEESARITAMKQKYPNFRCEPMSAQRRAIVTILRDLTTQKDEFVFYADRFIRLLVEDSLNEFPFERTELTHTVDNVKYSGVKFIPNICGVSIVRAGESMEAGLRAVCRGCRIGKILIQRDEKSLEANLIYEKLPVDIAKRHVLLMDPMLATGGSAIAALDVLVRKHGVPVKNIIFMNLVCVPEGLASVYAKYPDLKIVSAMLDTHLNEKGYIVPGFGDFGDRYFGTTN